MAKGTIQVDVQANTTQAAGQIRQLQSQVESKSKSTFGGLDSLKDLDKMVPGLKSIEGSLGGLGTLINSIGPSAGAFGALGASIGVVVDSMNQMVNRGAESRKELEKISTTLQTLDKNVGGAGRNMDDFVKNIQFMSANGVNSVEDLGDAAKTLMVAFQGSQQRTRELLSTFDDLSAGTGVQVSDWASMAAEVQLTGVSIKDLTRLSNRGIPIYQALGDTMNVTAEEAEAMAKAGKVGTEDWFNAVEKLHQSYKGLSKELSSKTLEGALSTFDASKKLRDQAAGEGYSDTRRRYLNAESEQMQQDANNPAMQGMLYEVGKVKGNLENLGDTLSTTGDKLVTFGNVVWGWLNGKSIGTQAEEAQAEYEKTQARKEVVDANAAYKNRANLSSGQIQDLLNTISSDKWGAFKGENGGLSDEWLKRRDELKKVLQDALDREEKIKQENARDAERDRKEAMTLKYGATLEDKVKAVSGHHGIMQIEPNKLESEINRIKTGLMDGTIEDTAQAEKNLSILEPLLKEYNHQLEEEARNKERLAQEQRKKEDNALQAKIDEDNARIKGKADIGKQITDAQGDYDTITSKLQEVQAIRAQIADEEAHGIFRKKWGNLNVSEVSTKEAQLLKEQQEAGKKLGELKDRYENYDKNWNQARTQIQNFFTSVVAGSVVPVKGVPITG